ncbi:MAG: hypothetical protein QOI10_3089 [Solirubrobacterales bacterium]|nr:hypothetical protein [Solirubrobacterales bacterium]
MTAGRRPTQTPAAKASADAPLPAWIGRSELLTRAQALAAEAHRDQRRATDQAPFLDHVVEVGRLLNEAGYDDRIVAAGLLHDSVERGTLSEAELRERMDDEISGLVLALTEDAGIESFEDRKAALREQVRAAGGRAITIFAADKLSDIRGLRRGLRETPDSIGRRMETTVDGMASHYTESVTMIEAGEPGSPLVAALHRELDELASDSAIPAQ